MKKAMDEMSIPPVSIRESRSSGRKIPCESTAIRPLLSPIIQMQILSSRTYPFANTGEIIRSLLRLLSMIFRALGNRLLTGLGKTSSEWSSTPGPSR
jgi:hypothetical protein